VDDPGPGASYARAVRLSGLRPGRSRTLLATFQQFGRPGFPIFRSDDGGRTWHQQGNVPNTGEAAGVWLQPFLYELPRAFAGLPKGAVLCAGNSLDHFSGTSIVLYASTDHGLTWQFLSTVAKGGAPVPENGHTPVWEPFLLLHRDRLICYYSDQRDPKYGQKISHQASTDLRRWGPVVTDAVGTDYSQRPGMATVAQVRHSMWIMTHAAFGCPYLPGERFGGPVGEDGAGRCAEQVEGDVLAGVGAEDHHPAGVVVFDALGGVPELPVAVAGGGHLRAVLAVWAALSAS